MMIDVFKAAAMRKTAKSLIFSDLFFERCKCFCRIFAKKEKDMSLEDFEIGFALSSNSCSYNRLCQFGNAMRWGLYIPISDEDIRKGVD